MLKKLWQTLLRLWNRIFKPTPPPPPPAPKPHPTRSDAEYEAIFIKILEGVNNGCSRGNLKSIFTSENVREEELQGWLCRFAATEFVINVVANTSSNEAASVESLRQMAGRMVQFGRIYGGKLGEEAVQLGEQILSVPQPENGDISEVAEPENEENEEAEAWWKQGGEQFQIGDFEGALGNCNRAIEINANFYKAWTGRGAGLFHLGRTEEAIASWDKAIEIKPDSHYAWNNRGVALKNLGRYEEAIASYDKAIEIKPDDHQVWTGRGAGLFHLGRTEEAIASYDKAIEIKPDDPEAWTGRGAGLFHLGRTEEAIASWDKAIEIKPDSHYAWNNRGVALRNLGRYEEAMASYDKAIEIKPDDPEAWYNRGNALADLGRYEEAIASYDQAVEIKPAYHEAWYSRGNALKNLGRYEEAIASYDQAVEIKPAYHEAWYSRGNALDNLGRYEEAIASYDQALEIKPAYHEAWNNRGAGLFHLGRYEEAIASYDQALEIKPDSPEAWTGRGAGLFHLGRTEEAIASWDKAIEIKPAYHEAWNNRGAGLFHLGRYEEAIASYDQALEIKPAYHQAWIGRGNAAGSLKRRSPDCPFPLSPIFILNQWGYAGKLASFQEGLKHCQKDTHPEGWGKLHHAIGDAQYYQGKAVKQERSARWQEAWDSYHKALETLTASAYPEQHLEVLKSLIRLLLKVGDTENVLELKRKATDVFQNLIQNTPSPAKQKQLQLKFAEFNQLTVDILARQGKKTEALAVAEAGKNTCLRWLLSPDADESPSPTYDQIQQFLTSPPAPLLPGEGSKRGFGLIYWHQSPVALTTFILTPSLAEPIVLSDPDFERLEKFEKWMKEWDGQYNATKDSKDSKDTEQNPAWIESLPAKLTELAEILQISEIFQHLNQCETLTQLILIPHQDLHRFPLHILFLQLPSFPKHCTLSYLPSLQFGINLKTNFFATSPENEQLLSIENPYSTQKQDDGTEKRLSALPTAEIEAEIVCQLFTNPDRIGGKQATLNQVKPLLSQPHHILHFTGHGYYEPSNPDQSALFLTHTDKLTAAEIIQFDLSTYHLICLAACETAVTGHYNITTEYVGLISAFLRANARAVVSTLWQIRSDAGTLLMIEFYQQRNAGIPEPIALINAQKWLQTATREDLKQWYEKQIQTLEPHQFSISKYFKSCIKNLATMNLEQPYKNPYFWAAFTYTGL